MKIIKQNLFNNNLKYISMKKNVLYVLTMIGLLLSTSCQKEEEKPKDTNDPKVTSEYMLVIKTGAHALKQGMSITYECAIVDKTGTITEVSDAVWSVGNENVATISSSGKLSAVGQGETYVVAKKTHKGVDFYDTVPVGVYDANIPFTVLPGAIIWSVDGGPLELFSIYLGTQTASYTYSSSDATVASVSATSGSSIWVHFHKPGTCNITVKGTIGGKENTFIVPVMVIGEPPIPVPVARVEISPQVYEMIMGESKTFSVKAFNGSGVDVTGQYPVVWEAINAEDEENDEFFGPIATINQNGKLDALYPGVVTVKATIEGITSQATVYIYPKKMIEVSPFYVDIKPGAKQQFTAETIEFNRVNNKITPSIIANPTDITWMLMNSEIPFMTAIGTISATGELTVSQQATPLSFDVVIAYSPSNQEIMEGAALVTVEMDMPINPFDPNDPNDPFDPFDPFNF